MLVRYVLFTLPVHRRPFADYYREHDEEVTARREALEREWGGQAFEELPPHIRLYWKDQWRWPPWFFNDVVGHVKVGSDGDSSVLADLFLERRYFPPTAPERFAHSGGHVGQEREMLFLSSIERRPVTLGDNASYVTACRQILDDARRAVREQGDGLADAGVWIPGFDLDCLDLARADRQLRERFPNRTTPR
jgi:hypothetical protein